MAVSQSLRDRAYRLAIAWRGPAYWHWRHYGWDYRARHRDGGWDLHVLGRDLRVADLSGWCAPGGTIHIVLSGPSVGAVVGDPALHAMPTIAVNGSFRALAPRSVDLYLVSDVGFVRRQWPTVREALSVSRALAVDHRVLLEILRRDPALPERIDVRVFDNLTRPYGRSANWWRQRAAGIVARGREGAFSMDAAAGFHPSCTVAHVALQIAAAQRPRRIVLFGLDLCDGRFYGEATPERTMLAQDLQRHIVPDLRLAAACLRSAGIEVINASPNSALPDDVFPRCRPEDALRP